MDHKPALNLFIYLLNDALNTCFKLIISLRYDDEKYLHGYII